MKVLNRWNRLPLLVPCWDYGALILFVSHLACHMAKYLGNMNVRNDKEMPWWIQRVF